MSAEQVKEDLDRAVEFHADDGLEPPCSSTNRRDPWAKAASAKDFIAAAPAEIDWLLRDFAVRGGVTVLASPRGLGKTQITLALAIAKARGTEFRGEVLSAGRVLYLDRDNPPSELRRRLKAWGADQIDRLDILTRDDCPPLTDAAAWSSFPLRQYELVILDSLSAATEGVREGDGGETGKALASLLDIARKGPAVMVLANTRRDGAVLRGSGVIQDRADIIFEIRDATGLKLQPGKESWIDSLPEATDASWSGRAKRRMQRDRYRLAVVPTKFRVGEEPASFVLEIALPEDSPWSITDVTEEVEREFESVKGEADLSRQREVDAAVDGLKLLIAQRFSAGTPIGATEAVEILVKNGMPRDSARQIRDKRIGRDWLRTGSGGKGSGSKTCFIPISTANPDGSNRPTQTVDSRESKFASPLAEEPQASPHFQPLPESGSLQSESLPTTFAEETAEEDGDILA